MCLSAMRRLSSSSSWIIHVRSDIGLESRTIVPCNILQKVEVLNKENVLNTLVHKQKSY